MNASCFKWSHTIKIGNTLTSITAAREHVKCHYFSQTYSSNNPFNRHCYWLTVDSLETEIKTNILGTRDHHVYITDKTTGWANKLGMLKINNWMLLDYNNF